MITIAVDCMGGDHGPSVTLPACRHFLDKHPDVSLLRVGLPQALAGFSHARVKLVNASEVVAMDDPLEVALRRKKDSSMRVAIEQVKDGTAQVAVSAGNTAALMAIARYVLKTLDGIDSAKLQADLPAFNTGKVTAKAPKAKAPKASVSVDGVDMGPGTIGTRPDDAHPGELIGGLDAESAN